MGKFGVWESAVPPHIKSPVEGALSMRSSIDELFAPDEEDNHDADNSGTLDQIGGDGDDLNSPVDKKCLHRKTYSKDDSDENNSIHIGLYPPSESRKRPISKPAESLRMGSEELDSIRRSEMLKMAMQDAFQPGSMPIQDGKRHFLCYNMIGSITSFKSGESSHVEVDFHDTGRGFRVPSMTDYFGVKMAALNDSGCLFANPHRVEKNTSTLMYRPFSSWANNSEWSMRFDAEEVKNVALGVGWVAAITSLNFLRIFTEEICALC